MDQKEIDAKLVWLLNRKGIGASEAAACLGLSPWKTKAEAYDDIVARLDQDVDYLTAQIKEFDENPDIKRGNALEEHGAALYTAQTGVALVAWDQTKPAVHPAYPWLSATPDYVPAVIGPLNYAVEVKAPRGYTVKRLTAYGLTEPWVVQGQLQCVCVGVPELRYALIAADAWELHIIAVKYDEELCDKIVAGLLEFWENHILQGVRPVDVEEAVDIPDTDGEILVTNEEPFATLAKVLVEARREREEWDGIYKQGVEAFKKNMELQDTDVLEVPDVARVHWSHSKPRSSFDAKKVEAYLRSKGEEPDDYKKTARASRPFRLYPLQRRTS